MNSPVIRVGLANPNSRMAIEMEKRDVPVMISANSLFDHDKKKFREFPLASTQLDFALDSAGFVAMAHYKRYPWSVPQYVEAAIVSCPTWWSQMDFCCEPGVARDREAVMQRVHATAKLLEMCREEYFQCIRQAPEWEPASTPPMPIAQGWEPDDYKLSVELMDDVLGGDWPDLIGVGSVCRRHLNGPDGLWRVLHALDTVLPDNVRLHLFGVKGSAIQGIAHHPRVLSVDSMAFELHARIDAREAKVSKTTDFRISTMERWLGRQTARRPEGAEQFQLSV